jgi:hypothetical protein
VAISHVFSFGFPQNRAGLKISKSDRLPPPRLVILFDSDYHASRLAPADSYDRTMRNPRAGEIRWGKWKRKKMKGDFAMENME